MVSNKNLYYKIRTVDSDLPLLLFISSQFIFVTLNTVFHKYFVLQIYKHNWSQFKISTIHFQISINIYNFVSSIQFESNISPVIVLIKNISSFIKIQILNSIFLVTPHQNKIYENSNNVRMSIAQKEN